MKPVGSLDNKTSTIGRDGFSLQPFSPCFWTGSVSNFNGIAFEYHNDSWFPVHISEKSDHIRFLSMFNTTSDHVGLMLKDFQKTEAISMNLLAELSGLVQERGGTILSDVIQEISDKHNLDIHLTFFDKLKTFAFVVLIILT